ncbi:glycosyltransferase family 9 protein [Selenomonas sp. TAMA-11512]|uniref:glycosyltransferase family 9 protein n=1 Tax=Selenomonas sp. TAMA-11512 TaxID=3095337 RepID=UPI0030861E69|nr:glycosyltransferase family 9 protein [Selenomonas sp. TAMA-11512]
MNRYMEAAVAYLGYPLMAFRRRKLHGGRQRNECPNILILRPDRIGDFVVTTPFIREVRSNFPDAHITLVVSRACFELAEPCPYVDEVLMYQKAYASHKYMSNYRAAWAFAREHFTRTYDYAFLPSFAAPDAYGEAWLAFYSGAKHRVGYTEKVSERKSYWYMGGIDLYLNRLVYTDRVMHEVESALHLLEAEHLTVGERRLELWTTEAARRKTAELFERLGIHGEKKRLLLNLSTSNREKDWPTDRYAAVVETLREEFDFALLLIGAGADAREYRDRFAEIYTGMYHDLTDQLSLVETVALMHESDYYLGGDTGPMHMAAEAGLKGVVLYKDAADMQGIVPSKVFSPWQSPLQVMQPEHNLAGCEKGCHRKHHCIAQIDAGQVIAKMRRILEE